MVSSNTEELNVEIICQNFTLCETITRQMVKQANYLQYANIYFMLLKSFILFNQHFQLMRTTSNNQGVGLSCLKDKRREIVQINFNRLRHLTPVVINFKRMFEVHISAAPIVLNFIK